MASTGLKELSLAMISGGFMVDGTFIPEDMVVGTSGWSISYN